MSIPIADAVREHVAGRGTLKLARPDGVVEDVSVPAPGAAADDGDFGPPHLAPPFPAPLLTGERVVVREGRITPFQPVAVGDSDLAPE